MASPQPKFDTTIDVRLPAARAVEEKAMEGDAAWSESPALALHQRLLDSFATVPRPVDSALSLQARMAILIGTALAMWLVIAGTVMIIVR